VALDLTQYSLTALGSTVEWMTRLGVWDVTLMDTWLPHLFPQAKRYHKVAWKLLQWTNDGLGADNEV
jgi:hypothetical protein